MHFPVSESVNYRTILCVCQYSNKQKGFHANCHMQREGENKHSARWTVTERLHGRFEKEEW